MYSLFRTDPEEKLLRALQGPRDVDLLKLRGQVVDTRFRWINTTVTHIICFIYLWEKNKGHGKMEKRKKGHVMKPDSV